jgi:hypothetical protein
MKNWNKSDWLHFILIFTLGIFCLLPAGRTPTVPSAAAQVQPSAFLAVPLQSAAVATGNGQPATMVGYNTVCCQVLGTFVGTITFEETLDGTNWVSSAGYPSGGTASASSATYTTTATAPGIWTFPIPARYQFRARISAYTSGSITVNALVASSAR